MQKMYVRNGYDGDSETVNVLARHAALKRCYDHGGNNLWKRWVLSLEWKRAVQRRDLSGWRSVHTVPSFSSSVNVVQQFWTSGHYK